MKTPMQERDQSQHLITQAQAGDRRSFDELMAQYRGQLESVVRSSLDPEIRAILDVDGIVQEVFLRGRTGEAERLLVHALDLVEQNRGRNHAETAARLDHLAEFYAAGRRWSLSLCKTERRRSSEALREDLTFIPGMNITIGQPISRTR